MKILFLHGLESGPHGSKYQALKTVFNDVTAPDCSGLSNEAERLQVICNEIDSTTDPYLVVGSSMGGLMAMLLQQARPQRVAGMVLCAPALHRPAAQELTYTELPPLAVIHGDQDDVVPLEVSLPFGHQLTIVRDGHRLSDNLPLILRAVFDLQLQLANFKE